MVAFRYFPCLLSDTYEKCSCVYFNCELIELFLSLHLELSKHSSEFLRRASFCSVDLLSCICIIMHSLHCSWFIIMLIKIITALHLIVATLKIPHEVHKIRIIIIVDNIHYKMDRMQTNSWLLFGGNLQFHHCTRILF